MTVFHVLESTRFDPETDPAEWPTACRPSRELGAVLGAWRLLSWHFGDDRAFWVVERVNEHRPTSERFRVMGAVCSVIELNEDEVAQDVWRSIEALLGVEIPAVIVVPA